MLHYQSEYKTQKQKVFIVQKTTNNQVVMVYFTNIRKSVHYILYHEKTFPWSKVIEIILKTKNMRKKGDKLEIETPEHYILCKLENNILWVINAKYRK
mgnify:CR=1 FL=1